MLQGNKHGYNRSQYDIWWIDELLGHRLWIDFRQNIIHIVMKYKDAINGMYYEINDDDKVVFYFVFYQMNIDKIITLTGNF